MSDHYILSCTYNNSKINHPQQFKITRNFRLLTKYKLNQYFSNNEALQGIFSEQDPNIIAETLVNEISMIIECIAPSKKIRCKNSYAPWVNEDFLRESKIKGNLHKIAKGTNNEEDWRKFRQQ